MTGNTISRGWLAALLLATGGVFVGWFGPIQILLPAQAQALSGEFGKEALLAAYRTYLKDADPLDDAPSIAVMTRSAAELEAQLLEMKELAWALPDTAGNRDEWKRELEVYLVRSGGVYGEGEEAGIADLPLLAGRTAYTPPLAPRISTFSPGLIW